MTPNYFGSASGGLTTIFCRSAVASFIFYGEDSLVSVTFRVALGPFALM